MWVVIADVGGDSADVVVDANLSENGQCRTIIIKFSPTVSSNDTMTNTQSHVNHTMRCKATRYSPQGTSKRVGSP